MFEDPRFRHCSKKKELPVCVANGRTLNESPEVLHALRWKQYSTFSIRSFVIDLFSSLEDKISIFAPPCNILYV